MTIELLMKLKKTTKKVLQIQIFKESKHLYLLLKCLDLAPLSTFWEIFNRQRGINVVLCVVKQN